MATLIQSKQIQGVVTASVIEGDFEVGGGGSVNLSGASGVTGSFTGSFKGDGSELTFGGTGIVSRSSQLIPTFDGLYLEINGDVTAGKFIGSGEKITNINVDAINKGNALNKLFGGTNNNSYIHQGLIFNNNSPYDNDSKFLSSSRIRWDNQANILYINDKNFIFSSLKDRAIYTFSLSKEFKLENLRRIEIGERVRDMIYEKKQKQVLLFLEDTASIGKFKLE